MNAIRLHESCCRSPDAFWNALLAALKVPAWHGRNLDALWDSLTGGHVSTLQPPFAIEVVCQGQPPAEVQKLITDVHTLFDEARVSEGVRVAFHLQVLH
jgi:RNAse (barnase) inhibitor barstar